MVCVWFYHMTELKDSFITVRVVGILCLKIKDGTFCTINK